LFQTATAESTAEYGQCKADSQQIATQADLCGNIPEGKNQAAGDLFLIKGQTGSGSDRVGDRTAEVAYLQAERCCYDNR
jgi:hypothetical protein